MAGWILRALPVVLPLLTVFLWLISGRQTFTKSSRAVTVPVHDELFGETFLQEQMVRGPILGYYIGLDLVILVLVASVLVAAIAWWIRRRRHVRAVNPGGAP